MTPYYQDDSVTIYHGDARYILPDLAPADVILTDPPYGTHCGGFGHIENDDGSLDLEFLFDRPEPKVVFGASHFPHALPHPGTWVVWDKRTCEAADRALGAPFELAWADAFRGDRMIRVMHGGPINSDGGKRVHPTQKPVRVFTALIDMVGPEARTILDPFMGSGTTLRAAKDLGRQAIGIEVDRHYCEVAVRRLAQEVLAI